MSKVGIDLVPVARIKAAYERYGDRFLNRLYTSNEVDYALAARGDRRFERLAARFAAKEALVKAVGHALPYRSIEVSHAPGGAPVVTCALVKRRITASLSHTRELAVACILLDEA
jgi:holo-[acyl-carrier protein] synthase